MAATTAALATVAATGRQTASQGRGASVGTPPTDERPASEPETLRLLARPTWHETALRRGQGPDRWTLEERGRYTRLTELARICQQCPVSGHCLREAIAEQPRSRVVGPVRLGITGRAWTSVRRLVAQLQPDTDDDWDTLAAWLLDGVLNRAPDHSAPDSRRRWTYDFPPDQLA